MYYINPVYPGSCPDPFILKYCGEYWCYSTGWASDGRVFNVLHSVDLVHWTSLGGAMDPLPGDAPEYWAPEAIYSNGRFYLYYSVGDGFNMKLRAAVAMSPEGPFHDSGRALTREAFAIDAHFFEDEDGSKYLFYATDFLNHTHIGTGTVVDRMIDELTLEGNPRPVTLPRFDWQVFDPHRIEKGGVRWHTVEGPFVLKRKGRYYQMFSGGNWKNPSYGVSYALADSIHSREEWSQLEHSREVPLVLSTIPGVVVGPGHNSVVRGPDNRQLYCVYHRWAPDGSARLLSLDRLEWVGDRLSVLGPSTTPQENPNAPLCPIFRQTSGLWLEKERELIHPAAEEPAEAGTELASSSFMIEVSLAASPDAEPDQEAEMGLRLSRGGTRLFAIGFSHTNGSAVVCAAPEEDIRSRIELPHGFPISVFHGLRVEVNGARIDVEIDGRARRWRGRLKAPPDRLTLFSNSLPCSFKACSITYGFEDDFYGIAGDPDQAEWHTPAGISGVWRIVDGELLQEEAGVQNSLIVKEHSLEDYELVVNARLVTDAAPDSCYGFYPLLTGEGEGALLRVELRENWPQLVWQWQRESGAWPLPAGFDLRRAEQFRFRRRKDHLQVFREGEALGTLEIPCTPGGIALYVNRARAAFDLVRLTSLNQPG